jgi:perosamine synthetase
MSSGEQIPASRPFLWGNERDEVVKAIESGWISSRGPAVLEFEQGFRSRVQRRYALAVSSGTAAIHLALESLSLKPGDEVIVPDFCMIAPIFAILYCGAIPVPVDVDETWNLNPELLAPAITARTRAVLVVHNYGHPAAMHRISEIAAQRGIPIVEDAAEVLGATVLGRQAGSFGQLACFSLYANKLITTGEGGMLTTDDPELYERARWKRDMCFGAEQEDRFVHQEVGFNYRLTSLQAAVGVAQLQHFDEALLRKVDIADKYTAGLAGTRGLALPPLASWATNAYWLYGVVVDPAFGVSRLKLQQELTRRGIETRRFFAPVHEQPFLRGRLSPVDCPRSSYLAENGLCLPSFIGMTLSNIERVVGEIKAVQSSFS